MSIKIAHTELSPFIPDNDVYSSDYYRALSLLESNLGDQYHRRVLVRSAFAYIEGIIYVFKGSIAGLLLAQHFQAIRCDMTKLLQQTPYTGFLKDTGFTLSEKGEVKEKKEFINLKTNIQYLFKVAAKTYKSTYTLEKNGQGWECFLRSVKVRDRITHPKDRADMTVEDIETNEVIATINWFENAVEELLNQVDLRSFLITLSGPGTDDAISKSVK